MSNPAGNVLAIIKERGADGNFVILPHAVQRGLERQITDMDIAHALLVGEHEVEKDIFRPDFYAWNHMPSKVLHSTEESLE